MSNIERINGELRGPLVEARNWSADAAGSIHDDATASKLGFRGGTVAGNIHMDQFVPLLLEAYGPTWFERGYLSLYFQNATTDGEPVRAFAGDPKGTEAPIDLHMERADGLEVMRGNAGLGDVSQSALHTRDLRGGDPSGLRIMKTARTGLVLGPESVVFSSELQRERLARDWISAPLDWYGADSPWGGALASPSGAVELLWRKPTELLRPHVGRAVGLFGAIEIAHVNGPILMDETYDVRAEVVAVGESPKTEFLWFDSSASKPGGEPVATMRMLLRFMKASSPRYVDA